MDAFSHWTPYGNFSKILLPQTLLSIRLSITIPQIDEFSQEMQQM